MMTSLSSFITIGEAKRALTAEFRAFGLDNADLDARVLIMKAAEMSRADLITRMNDVLTRDQRGVIKSLAARRIAGEPVDHILGFREFYGRQFKITKDVLSPRPETEMLVDEALNLIKEKPKARILDLGTGSGAIVISLLAELGSVTATATDISKAALSIARENAKQFNLCDRIDFRQGEWFEPVEGKYNIIISNPPYIRRSVMNSLQPEVKNFDPELALSGGLDGLDAYKSIISKAKPYLSLFGEILFEIGFDQGASVTKLLEEAGFGNILVQQDLAGHDRIVMATVLD